MKSWSKIALLCALGTAAVPALAQNQFSLGGAMGYSQYVYKDYDHLILPIPMINYNSDTFYVRGLSAGYYLFQNRQQSVALDLSYSPRQFDPDDTDNAQLKFLGKRHSTVLLGARYHANTDYGKWDAALHFDAADESDGGITANVNYSYPLSIDRNLTITPAVGIDWHNDKYNDYYYGVSQREANASGLSAYHADGGVSPYVNLGMRYRISDDVTAAAAVRYTWLSDEVSDSPMAGRDGIYSTFVSVSYHF